MTCKYTTMMEAFGSLGCEFWEEGGASGATAFAFYLSDDRSIVVLITDDDGMCEHPTDATRVFTVGLYEDEKPVDIATVDCRALGNNLCEITAKVMFRLEALIIPHGL